MSLAIFSAKESRPKKSSVGSVIGLSGRTAVIAYIPGGNRTQVLHSRITTSHNVQGKLSARQTAGVQVSTFVASLKHTHKRKPAGGGHASRLVQAASVDAGSLGWRLRYARISAFIFSISAR